MSHRREPIPYTCPQIDKIVGKIKYLSKQLPRDWGKLDDLEKLQELANEMQDLLEDCNSEFELLRRSNESLRNWGEQEAADCDELGSRPTCGEEQRKFLDEIEKMSEYIPPRKTYDRMEVSASIIGSHEKDPYCYELWQCDFTADLSKVIKGE